MIDIKISSLTLSVDACIAKVSDENAGGTAVFIGTVRKKTRDKNVIQLDFEAYGVMAEKEMKKIAEESIKRWSVLHVSIHHRTGILKVGEIAVIIAVSAPHRKAAFEACQYAIDTLKETVPIWKKEIFEDGEVWVNAHP